MSIRIELPLNQLVFLWSLSASDCRRTAFGRLLPFITSLLKTIERLLKAIVKQNFDPATPDGCLVALAAQERRLHDTDTQAAIAKEFHKLDDALCARLTKDKSDGEFSDDLDPRGTSTAILSICAGLFTLGRGNYSKHALQRAPRAVASLFG